MLLLGVPGCYGYVVEHAESVGSSPLAVVSRRPGGEPGASQGHCAFTGPPCRSGGCHAHLTRASPLRTAPVSTASTSCSAAPAASLAQWKVLCGGEVQVSPRPPTAHRLSQGLCQVTGRHSRVPAVAANRAQYLGVPAVNSTSTGCVTGGRVSQGTHRMEVDGIVLLGQGLELPGAQGLGPPQQRHILGAAKRQAGSPRGAGRGERDCLPHCSLAYPHNGETEAWGEDLCAGTAGWGSPSLPGPWPAPHLTCAPGPAPPRRPRGLPAADTFAPDLAAAGAPRQWSGAQDTRSHTQG